MKRFPRFSAYLLAAALALVGGLAVRAQGAATVTASPPDLSAFPDISLLVDVRDASGEFVSGLQAENFAVLEDGQESPVLALEETRPGGQFVIAINPGQSFDIRDGQGVSRYEYAAQALTVWAAAQAGSPTDRLSLVTPTGALATRTTDPAAWLAALSAYLPDTTTLVPGLEPLGAALTLVSDAPPDPGMGRAILLITPSVSNEAVAAMESLAERALASGTRIHVWLIDSPQLFESANALALRNLAQQTGGQFFAFSGLEPIPDLYALLESSRRTYEISYRSRLTNPGTHSLSVRVVSPQASAASEARLFELALQPPNPIFVSPPGQIVRFIPEGERIAFENLQPTRQSLEILVEFPDTIQRDLVRTTLYVNNEAVAENLAPPFEFFTLDLTTFLTSAPVTLVVEAEDELGQVGRSIETPLTITVLQPDRSLAAMFRRNIGVISIASVVAAGAILALVLVLAGRWRPRPLSDSTRPRPATDDPVTQPLRLTDDTAPAPPPAPPSALARLVERITAPRLRWPQRAAVEAQPQAYLVRIGEDGEPIGDGVFSVVHREVTFGSDPAQVNLPLEDPAVEPIHARLWRAADGQYRFADNNSVAGTWLNYAPVAAEGSPVEHGDLLHVARIGFRFTLSNPGKTRRPTVTPLNGKDGHS